MNCFISNFIPILLVFLFAFYTDTFVLYSHTVLGKAFAVLLIIFYANTDIIIGLFACVLIILYYQTDFVESFYTNVKPKTIEKMTPVNTTDVFIEKDSINHPDTIPLKNFREIYCKNGHLLYKNQIVKQDIIQHVFPELKQSENKCNICDTQCPVEIIERISNESQIQNKNNSNDIYDKVFKNLLYSNSTQNN
jgi:predicted membrane protein